MSNLIQMASILRLHFWVKLIHLQFYGNQKSPKGAGWGFQSENGCGNSLDNLHPINVGANIYGVASCLAFFPWLEDDEEVEDLLPGLFSTLVNLGPFLLEDSADLDCSGDEILPSRSGLRLRLLFRSKLGV